MTGTTETPAIGSGEAERVTTMETTEAIIGTAIDTVTDTDTGTAETTRVADTTRAADTTRVADITADTNSCFEN